MSQSPRRVALWNGSGMDNVGDYAIDWVTRRELARRLPGIECETFSPWQGRYCQNRLWIDRKGFWPGHGLFNAIVIGGGALILGPPFRDPTGQFFLLGPSPGDFRDSCPIVWNGICSDSQHRAPLSPLWRDFVSTASGRVSYRAVRNERSRHFLASCGVGEVEVVPDVCVVACETARRRRGRMRPKIAVVAGRPVFPYSFISKVAELARTNLSLIDPALVEMRPYEENSRYSDEEYTARLCRVFAPTMHAAALVVAAFGEMYGDDLACSLLAEKLCAPCLKLWELELDGILEFLADVDVVIGFRLHSCVLALSVGTPFVAVDPYLSCDTNTSKLREFMMQCGVGKFYFSLSQLIDEPDRISDVLADAVIGALEIAAIRDRLAGSVSVHFDRLAEKIAV